MDVLEQPLEWGVNCDVGWIGFISRHNDFIADGINWFSRWDEISKIPITHTFIITGPDSTIEAFNDGVRTGTLSAYLNDPNVALLVRRPIGWTPDMGGRIVSKAQIHVGEGYDDWLIFADAVSNTLIGHWLDHVSNGSVSQHLTQWADSAHKEICSKLVAIAMSQPETQSFGVLANTPASIKPIDLFEDQHIFTPGAIELVPATDPAAPDKTQTQTG
jgi:hypothetical protein